MAGKVLKSFAWDFFGRILSQFVSIIVSIVLARILTPSEFGLVGMSMVFIAMSGLFTNLGLASALIQHSKPEEIHYSSSFYLNISAAFVLTFFFILVAPWIAKFFHNDAIINLIRVLSVSLLITSFSTVQEARLRKAMKFKVLAQAKILGSIISGVIGIYMALNGFGVWSLVMQTIIGRFIPTIYYWLISSWRPKLLFKFKAIKELWNYSFNLLIAGILDTVYRQLDSIIIARIFSANELGLFSKAKSLNQFAIKYSSESITTVTFPALSSLKEERSKAIDLALKSEIFIAFVTFGLLGWLFVTSESLILTLLGQKWVASVHIFRLLCLSGFVYPVSSASLSLLQASGDSRSYLKVEIIKKTIGLTGLAIGFLFGLDGYLISLIITGIISVLLNMFFTGRSMGISIGHQLLPILPYLIIGIIVSFIIEIANIKFRLNIITFILVTLLYFSVYLCLNIILKTVGYKIFYAQIKQFLSVLINKLKPIKI